MTMMCLQRPNLTTHPGTAAAAATAENRFPGMSVCFVLGFACLARVLERKVIRVVSVRSVKRISALSVLCLRLVGCSAHRGSQMGLL